MADRTYEPYIPGETIAAVATPPGEGGVAIIRISGDQALEIANRVFSGDVHRYKTHTAHYGKVVDSSGESIDQALLLVMRAPRSYTGEDTVEIHCHGGRLITEKVLETVVLAGARAARPGEFTFKAFINEKIDLAQAEAVQELIGARNVHAVEIAGKQLEGKLSNKILHFQKTLTELAAILEAWIDFPDEGLEFISEEEFCKQLRGVIEEMETLEGTYHDGKILHEGISLCLVGTPNVGKSSLMNALLDRERAIVTHIAGTTRDILEDSLRINGLNFRLIDTAGVREDAELIEMEGIRRTKMAMEEADLILLVLDAHRGIETPDRALLEKIPEERLIIVWNKIDVGNISEKLPYRHQVEVSAKLKLGIEMLHQEIDRVIWDHGPPSGEEVLITSLRHKEALRQAIEAAHRIHQGIQEELSPEFLTLDMRACLQELGKVIGAEIGEDILSAIFSKFCIGK